MKALATILWGLFAACSWTWCIGLFMPILMLERFGWPGLLAFALPNLAGCTLFGYALSRERSRRLVQEHGTALRCFSAVTVAYHLYFAAWVTAHLVPHASPGWPALVAPLLVYAAALVLSRLSDQEWLLVALVVYALSLAVFMTLGFERLAEGVSVAPRDPLQLLFLAPLLGFGFLLCPYLDATFHRVRSALERPHAFAVFGLAFAVMIALTGAYRHGGNALWTPLVAAHMTAQCIFTVGAHLRELREAGGAARTVRTALPLPAVAPLLVLPVIFVVSALAQPARAAEDTYIRFLAFYGLAAPAYVLLFVLPRRPLPRKGRTLLAFAALIALSLPACEIGFLHGRAWVALLPLIALLAWSAWAKRAAAA